jgi:osmotically-inducible protein OsmY
MNMRDQLVVETVQAELARLGQQEIEVHVHNGVVTLVGQVADERLRQVLAQEILRLPQVLEVRNELALPAPEGDLPSQLRQLMESEGVAVAGLTIEPIEGGLRLRGQAQGWFDRDATDRLAWSLPGVREVINEISIPPDAPDPELAERRP